MRHQRSVFNYKAFGTSSDGIYLPRGSSFTGNLCNLRKWNNNPIQSPEAHLLWLRLSSKVPKQRKQLSCWATVLFSREKSCICYIRLSTIYLFLQKSETEILASVGINFLETKEDLQFSWTSPVLKSGLKSKFGMRHRVVQELFYATSDR